ncbi:DNA invertase Pin-like site-specific DNA recombinase [Aquamicrobium terrae]
MVKIGYARVSTVEQCLHLQIIALEAAGCSKIYRDEGISGASSEREGLNAALKTLQPGDMLVVWRLDRLGRSLLHLVDLLESFSRENIEFQSLTEKIDTSSAGGRLVFHMMAALAEFERHLISERTVAGMEAARLKGNHVGRPHVLTGAQRVAAARAVIEEGQRFVDVANQYQVHHYTIRRIVADARAHSEHYDGSGPEGGR